MQGRLQSVESSVLPHPHAFSAHSTRNQIIDCENNLIYMCYA